MRKIILYINIIIYIYRMDTLDNETLEQIKTIVNDAKNSKVPLQKAKRTKK